MKEARSSPVERGVRVDLVARALQVAFRDSAFSLARRNGETYGEVSFLPKLWPLYRRAPRGGLASK